MQKKRLIIDLSLMTVLCVMILLTTGCAKNEQKQEQMQEQSKTQMQNIEKNEEEKVTQQSDVVGNKKDTGGERPAMPEKAITACANNEVDEVCTVEMIDSEGSTRTMAGTCQSSPDDTETLACMPERGQGGGPQNGQGSGMGK